MANFKSKLPLAFSQNGIPISFLLIAIFTQLAIAMPGKDVKPSDSISFTSSDNDWSRDLDNVKPFAPSANAANMDSEIGRLDYKTFRFKVIRKLISVGPNLWNTMCYFAEKAAPPIRLELHDGYGPRTSSSCLTMDEDPVRITNRPLLSIMLSKF